MQSVNTVAFFVFTVPLLLSFARCVMLVEARMLAVEESVGESMNSMDSARSNSCTMIMVTIGGRWKGVKMADSAAPLSMNSGGRKSTSP